MEYNFLVDALRRIQHCVTQQEAKDIASEALARLEPRPPVTLEELGKAIASDYSSLARRERGYE
jgi:hypothetical protein